MAFTDDVITILDNIAPEFSGVLLLTKQTFVGYASEEHRVDMPRREIATAYLTAHMLELQSKSVAGGSVSQVKRERADKLEVEYAVTDNSEESLLSTKYGAEYMRIINKIKPIYSFVTTAF